MNYELIVSKKGADQKSIIDPTPEQIDFALDDMLPMQDEFIILECKKTPQNKWFIQTVMDFYSNETKNIYFVETRLIYSYDEKGWCDDFKHYRMTTADIELVKRLFRMYALDEIPDIGDWMDVTESLKVKISSKKC